MTIIASQEWVGPAIDSPIPSAQGINGLVGCDRVNPRSHRSPSLVLIHLHEHGDERVLKHICRQIIVANIATQVAVQFSFVPAHEDPEEFLLPALQSGEQHFVANFISLFVERCHPVILYAVRSVGVHSRRYSRIDRVQNVNDSD